jgi:hypothetical protein
VVVFGEWQQGVSDHDKRDRDDHPESEPDPQQHHAAEGSTVTDIAGERARLAAQGLNIITREAWGAVQSYTSARAVIRPARWLFLHISVTAAPVQTPTAEHSALRNIEAIGEQRFGIGCSYNAFACQSGRLYEGQPLTRRGAHTVNDLPNPNFPEGSLNATARALCIPQNVQDVVTDAQIDAAARWGAALRRSGEAVSNANWFGHRDVTEKSCPGPIAYARLPGLNNLTDHYTTVGLDPQEDSMSAEDVAALTAHINNTLRPFLVAAPTPDGAIFVDNRDGTLTWVQDQDHLKACRLDGVNHAGTQPDGVTPTPFTNRSEAHLRSLTIVGPAPPGW